jgi:glycerol-3-phosphate dehydrogenase subunit B
MNYDVIVIGAGMAGLVAATALAQARQRVLLLSMGIGSTHVGSGCIDVLGRAGQADVTSPRTSLPLFQADHAEHPYNCLSLSQIEEALTYFREQSAQAGWPYVGSLDDNWWLPTAVGAARPTCLAPEAMAAGDLRRRESILLVGFRQLRDFYPHFAAANLQQSRGLDVRAVYLDVPALHGHDNITPTELARAFDEPDLRAQVVRALKPSLGKAGRVGFPAVLGLRDATPYHDLSAALGRPLFEIPTLPPSVPGIRLFEAWRHLFQQAGGRFQIGFPVTGAEIADGRVGAVSVAASARPARFAAGRVILATGGIYGHGLVTDHTGAVDEPIFHLPLRGVPGREEWVADNPQGPHPIYAVGVAVDERWRPVAANGQPVFANLYAAGAIIAGGVGPRAGVGDAVAIATGYAAARAILSPPLVE